MFPTCSAFYDAYSPKSSWIAVFEGNVYLFFVRGSLIDRIEILLSTFYGYLDGLPLEKGLVYQKVPESSRKRRRRSGGENTTAVQSADAPQRTAPRWNSATVPNAKAASTAWIIYTCTNTSKREKPEE